MNKETLIEKITQELEKRKIANRDNFLTKSFVYPVSESDGEMTINGAQIVVVLSESTGIKYKLYKIEDSVMSKIGRVNFIQKLKAQYPGIIFFICNDADSETSKTIDTENNMIVVENEDFDAATELCGDVNKFVETML